MTMPPSVLPSTTSPSRARPGVGSFVAEWSAWTDTWEEHHPSSRGRFWLGDGKITGAVAELLGDQSPEAPIRLWADHALRSRVGADGSPWAGALERPEVARAVMALDLLLGHLFREHLGGLRGLNAASEVIAQLQEHAVACPPVSSPSTHLTLADPDLWFVWAAALEGADALVVRPHDRPARAALLAALLAALATHAAVHRTFRLRDGWSVQSDALAVIHQGALQLASDPRRAAAEIHELHHQRTRGQG